MHRLFLLQHDFSPTRDGSEYHYWYLSPTRPGADLERSLRLRLPGRARAFGGARTYAEAARARHPVRADERRGRASGRPRAGQAGAAAPGKRSLPMHVAAVMSRSELTTTTMGAGTSDRAAACE
jgi:hypothetical protein